MANSYLSRSMGGSGSTVKWTWSSWIKRSGLSSNTSLFGQGSSGDNFMQVRFVTDDSLDFRQYQSGSYTARKRTNRLFRDVNAWYHIVCQWDSANGTADDRMKIWVNGVQETSFQASTNPGGSLASLINSSNGTFNVGCDWTPSVYFDGYQSHTAFVDNAIVAPTVFGETDSTSGIWKFKSPSGVTWGNNGFHLKFENSAALGTDSSGNSNTFTVNGNLKQALNTPSNVYATWNPLAAHSSNVPFFTNGNTTVRGLDTSSQTVSSTLAMPSKGKWYCEMKLTQEANATSSIPNFGIIDAASLHKFRNQELISYNGGVNSYGGRVNSTNLYVDGSSSGTLSSAPDVGNIMGLAVDLDSSPNTLKYYLNGSLVGTQNINNDEYVFACSIKRDNNDGQVDVNFGNGFFGTTAITSAGLNGNGSLFEYDVPSGYYALNTKNINTYG